MSPIKIFAIVLILAGILALAYGSFSYTKKTTEAQIGNIAITATKKETVNIPLWAGIGAIVIGGGLLLIPSKK